MLFNRDLSWLGFNERVLQEAKNKNIPLYERLKFLAIFSSNLDEFFRIRYPSVVALSTLGRKYRSKYTNQDEDVANMVQEVITKQLSAFGNILTNELIPALKEAGVYFYYAEPIREEHRTEMKEIMLTQILSFMQPVFLGTESSQGFIPENSELYFIITIKEEEQDYKNVALNIPANKLKRFYELSEIDGMKYVVFIDDIVRENISLILPGSTIHSIYSIKFNRDAELKLEEDFSEKILEKIEKKLSIRDNGAPSRFLYQMGMPTGLQLFLASIFNVSLDEMFEGGRYHNLSDLFGFPVFNKELLFEKRKSFIYPSAAGNGEIFETIENKDILLHLPYDSYSPVLIFFNQAAVDPYVREIYITLYRVAKESHIVNALISAAKNGKKVTVFVELKARFDEANNIRWSRVMKEAGVKLIYSDPSIKVHSKIALVLRAAEKGKVKSYAIVSTGNFNESTAEIYTDHLLFTAKVGVIRELRQLFRVLAKQDPSILVDQKFTNLYVSPFNLLQGFEKLIDREIKKVKEGGQGLIRIKVNNLEEPYFIGLLYKASEAGVRIQMIVRSVCCLVPGKEGLSENITIKRIVGRYLEHSRIFIFGENEDAAVFMGSADLMIRNLRRRVEVCIRISDNEVREQLINYFDLQWNNNIDTVELNDKLGQALAATQDSEIRAQEAIYDYVKKIHR